MWLGMVVDPELLVLDATFETNCANTTEPDLRGFNPVRS